MSAVSLAIIGKSNEPLYLKEFFRDASSSGKSEEVISEEELFGLPPPSTPRHVDCSMRQQFLLHDALDRFEQLAGPHPGYAWRAPGVSGTDAMWVGLLCPVEDLRVYGYMTTTQIKFLLTVEDDSTVGDQRTVDETIKRLFVKLHRLYVEYTLNPFSPLTGAISSKKFDQKVKDCVTAYNRTLH